MLITLYDKDGNKKTDLQANDSSTQDKEIQADNVLSLNFNLYEHVGIDVNDYVDFMGERYWALEKYQPTEKSSVEWEYNVQLYGIESLIKRFLVLNNTDGENEAVFTLTGRPVDHVRLIVKCINDGMDHTTDFKVGSVEGTDNVVINYEGKYCDEALKELAEAVGTEWWIEGQTVNLCRCEWGDPVVLGYGKGLTSLVQDRVNNRKFYTRLFPIGSSRNIDREHYGTSRLQLPDGAKYIDSSDLIQKYGVIHHYEQEAFSGIYPRRVGEVSSVRSREVQDSDGKPYTIYYFKDNGLTFDPNDYEIGGLVKRVSFQEGSELAGLGTDNDHYFEVNFDSETREFEIITIWPYDDDRQLPGDTLVPKPGDKYILWNIRMPDEYYRLAEIEFKTAVEDYNKKHAQDLSCYKAPTDHVWIEETDTELELGRRVRLESVEYFPELGYRDSRITRISRSVNLPSQMDLDISDALSSGTLEKIDDAISDVKSYAGSILNAANFPDLIRSWDKTRPTDNNVYSARRSHKEFLSRQEDDTAEGALTIKGLLTLLSGVKTPNWSIDANGVARLLQIYAHGMTGNSFTTDDILTGQGFKISTDENGDGRIVTDYLTVRKKWFAMMLEVVKRQYSGGNLVFGSAGNRLIDVEGYDKDGNRVLTENDLDRSEQSVEIDCWASTRAEALQIASREYANRATFLVDEIHGVLTVDVDDEGSVVTKEEECAIGKVYTEMRMTAGDYMFLSAQGRWLDRDQLTEQGWQSMVARWRCYFLASDGDLTVDNEWALFDQARCETLNIRTGVTRGATNRSYWRLVVNKDDGDGIDHKGEKCHYIDLSNEETVEIDGKQYIGFDTSLGVEASVPEVYDESRYVRLDYVEMDGHEAFEDVYMWTLQDLIIGGVAIEIDMEFMALAENDWTILYGTEQEGVVNLSIGIENNTGALIFGFGNRWQYTNATAPITGKRLRAQISLRPGNQTVVLTDVDSGAQIGQWQFSEGMSNSLAQILFGKGMNVLSRRHYTQNSVYNQGRLPSRLYSFKMTSKGVTKVDFVAARDMFFSAVLYDRENMAAVAAVVDTGYSLRHGADYKKKAYISDYPQAEDDVAQMGNQENAERQSLVQIVVNGTEAPLLEGLAGINDYSLADKWVYRFSPRGMKMRADLLEMFTGTSEHGGGGVIVWRGNWMRGQTYYRNDVVKHNGSTWICTVAKGSSTTQEPADNSTDWDVYSEKGEKGDDGRGLNILGSADAHVETTDDSLDWLADKSQFAEYIILNDGKMGSEYAPIAERWKYYARTGWEGTGITSELDAGFTIHDDSTGNDDLWILTETGWDNRGAFSFKGEDGKDGEFILLEPDTLMLEQKFARNAQGDLKFLWNGNNVTTVRHMVGDTEKNDITSITLTWVANDDGNTWTFHSSIVDNEIYVFEPKEQKDTTHRGLAEIRVVAGGKEFVRYLTVVANALGTFHQETYKDITKEIRRRTVWQFDDNGVEQKYNYENQSYENALQKSKWITKIVNGSVEGGTLMQQTAEFIHFGFVSGVNYDETEEVITGNFKTGLKISEDGSEFTGDVYTLIEQEGSDDGIYGWRLSHDGSGSLAQGKISWTTDGTLTAKEGVFEKIQVVQSEIQKSVWSASGKDSQGHYGTYVNVGSINDGSNTTALSVRHDYDTNCIGDDWFAVLSYGNGGKLHLLSYHDWMTLQSNQLQYKGSNDSQRKTLADWASTRIKMHVPLVGVRRKLIELTSAGTIDLSETENEDYETIICRHSSGAATVKLPAEPAIANGKEITISQRVEGGTIKIQKHTTATAQIRIAGATPADEITLPYVAEYDWIERPGTEIIKHKNKMVYWGVKLIYNNNIWEALLMV